MQAKKTMVFLMSERGPPLIIIKAEELTYYSNNQYITYEETNFPFQFEKRTEY